jgi:hypothetical protein
VKFRAILFNVHGISSPLPVKHKKEWVVRLNAPNTYKAYTLCGIKGDWAQPLVVRVSKQRGKLVHSGTDKRKHRETFR